MIKTVETNDDQGVRTKPDGHTAAADTAGGLAGWRAGGPM
jgi:hypothetical protein